MTGRYSVKFFSFAICLMIISMLSSTFALPAHAQDSSKTIKVAYFDLGNYYKVNNDGSVNSFDSAYLNMISQYTDYNFEFVDCKTWEGAIEKLEAHEVDLVGTMQWTMEREEKYSICDTSYGYTVAELAALDSSPYIYEDYDAINGATVGYIDGYVIGDKLKSYMKKHNINFKIKTYDTQTKLDNALSSGEINLIAANAHAIHNDWKLIEKFDYAPFYFATWKGNEQLTDDISQAIIQINIHQGDFDDTLIKKYFPVMVSSPYVKEEMDLINKGETYTIYFDTDTKPVVWRDNETGKMQGTLCDICKQLEKTTGLKFNIVPSSEKPDTLGEHDVIYRSLNYETELNYSSEYGVSNAITDQIFELYHCVGDGFEIGGKYTIAVVKNRDGIKEYLASKYPQCSIVEYDTPQSCISAVNDKKADLTFINTHIANNVIISESYNSVVAVPLTEATIGIALQFQGENADLLAGIIDKGMRLIDTDAINEAMLKYSMNTSPKMNLAYLVSHHTVLTGVVILVSVIIIIAIIVLVFYAKLMRRERNKIQSVNNERSDFFARMSHDMRTPMNGILGMIELTEETKDINEVRENMQKAKLSGQYMLSLINDTLDLQRLESKKLKLEPSVVYLKSFYENISDMLAPSAKRKDIDFRIDIRNFSDDVYVLVDPVRVKQIFINILSNAVKFTPTGGTVEMGCERLSVQDDIASDKIQFRDTGLGISQYYIQNNLFKPYSQEHNKVTDKFAGSGLGLAISKNLIELMGGKIEVESELGEGTCFTVYLNYKLMNKAEAEKTLRLKSTDMDDVSCILEGRRILVCEDHPLNAEIARRLLEKAGCTVTIAVDGKQGADTFANSELWEFDAILMDMRMPVMDGIEATKAIRAVKREDSTAIPIIAMTANAYDSDKENCRLAGMTGHLAKPVDPKLLYKTLADQINSVNRE